MNMQHILQDSGLNGSGNLDNETPVANEVDYNPLPVSKFLITTESNQDNDTDKNPGSETHIHHHVISGLGLLALLISAAIIIAIIALVINKMKQKRKEGKDVEEDLNKDKNRKESIDPYLQAIIFPSEPQPDWKKYFSKTLKKATLRLGGKDEHHMTTIPDHLRHQLKHIYVY